ncbi:MAG: hypothetical protein ACOYLH_00785 [Flavobacteriales bacterium]|jgi:hypothetical protein
MERIQEETKNSQLELLDIELKQLEIEEKKKYLSYLSNGKSKDESDRLNLEKISTLSILLMGITIDTERTILGSEAFERPIFEGMEEEVIKSKIIELVKKL